MPNQIKMSDIRAKFPMYNDLSDDQLLIGVHKAYYPDIPIGQFTKRIEYDTAKPEAMGPLEKIGQVLTDAGAGAVRGAGSIGATILAPVDIASDALAGKGLTLQGNQQRRADMDAALQDLGERANLPVDVNSLAYKAGKVGTEIAGTLPVGGIVGKGIEAAGASRLGTAVASGGFRTGAPAATTLAGKAGDVALRTAGGAISGAATAGAVDPEQAPAGAAIGGVAPHVVNGVGVLASGAGKVLHGVANGVRAAVEPLTETGRTAIAARTLANAAGDDAAAVVPRMEQAAELVPGSAPTAAQVAENGGIAGLERAMAAKNPAPFAERAMDQAAARTQALRGIAGDEGTRAAAVSAREAATKDLYGQATGATYQMDDRLNRLLQTPAMQQAMQRAKVLAENNQRPFTFEVQQPDVMTGLGNRAGNTTKQITGQGLQDLKMAMDDMLKDPASGFQGASGDALRSLRGKLLVWMEDANPAYKAARTTYADMSKPVSQMDIGNELMQRLEPALSDHGALARETGNKYALALRNADQTARKATGFKGAGMEDVMTPEQLQIMQNIAKDLARKANSQDLGRGIGSDTTQKLVMGNMAQRAGAPNVVSTIMGMPKVSKVAKFLYAQPEEQIQQQVVQALLQPKTAAQMMKDELARKALASAPKQPMISPAARDAVGLLFARTSPLVLTDR